jgi:hypothetical protein
VLYYIDQFSLLQDCIDPPEVLVGTNSKMSNYLFSFEIKSKHSVYPWLPANEEEGRHQWGSFTPTNIRRRHLIRSIIFSIVTLGKLTRHNSPSVGDWRCCVALRGRKSACNGDLRAKPGRRRARTAARNLAARRRAAC